MKYTTLLILLLITLWNCENKDEIADDMTISEDFYFPPIDNSEWAAITPESLNWKVDLMDDLYDFLAINNTRAFLILKNGKIVTEKYWGRNVLDTRDFDQDTKWYWASAGKAITAVLVGLAQEDGALNITDKSADYLGTGWTSLTSEKENLISIRNQLTMTTGLDYQIEDTNCTLPICLNYREDAGNQWFYHNAPYTLLESVVSNATETNYDQYTDEKLEITIGMKGNWLKSAYNNVYWSSARDAARFGLLILNKGKWSDRTIIKDMEYYNEMINSSQQLNPSYGYLWWLNGKGKIIAPGLPTTFNVSLSPNAPEDLFAAMGKNGQFVDVIPSLNMVVIRMGEAADDSLVPTQLHDEMWQRISAIVQ